MTVAVWFRSDLRVQDNPALHAACRSREPVLALYFFTPDQFTQHGLGQNKQRFIIENLVQLSLHLEKTGIPLIAERCKNFTDSVNSLQALCQQHQIHCVHFNEEYELNEQRRDTLAFTRLNKLGIQVERHQDQIILAPGSVLTGQGGAFRVFTPFKRAWIKQARQYPVQPLPAPKKRAATGLASTPVATIDKWIKPQPANAFWPGGSKEAFRRLDAFAQRHMETYAEQRDFPAVDGTSQLSAYLAVGAISSRSCLHAALDANRFEWDSGSKGIQTWINELIWREFYKHLIFNFPELCKGKAFQPYTDGIRWQQQTQSLEHWKNATTGFPIVDAAMRQLNSLGWMHNRLRMVTAMFLTKHLFVDWRLGEAWFMQQLIDGDFAANNGGWQWSASTGADAAPYFRVFNPTRQSERFDSQGDFIRHWVPELKAIAGGAIHDPSPLERRLYRYPSPIVDHRTAVDRVKAEFHAVKAMGIA
jgi:deoxyribodipyrimidine photo-lyase